MAKSTRWDELTTIFTTPYNVEVRHEVFNPRPTQIPILSNQRINRTSPRRDLAAEVEEQIGRWGINPELADHADDLSAVHRGVIHDVLHLIDQPHRACIAAEKLEVQVSVEPVVIQP